MKYSELFPSNYLKSTDLKKPRKLTIERIELETLNDEEKPVLFFKEVDQGLVLNKTNALTLADAYGDDTDSWVDRIIQLVGGTTTYQGRPVSCVRIVTAKAAAKARAENSGSAADDPF